MHIKALLAAVVVTLGASRSGWGADGEDLFGKNCANCHGKDGKAASPIARKLGVKDLSQSKLTDAEIEKQIREGKKDERGREKMPSFKAKLSEDEIKSIITIVKGFRK